MSRSKGLWGKLFPHGEQRSDENSNACIPSQKKEVLDALKSEYGIEIMQTDLTRADLMQNGYRRLSPDGTAQASMVLQYIPQFAALSSNNRVVSKAFQAATTGSYRIRLADGMHLAASKLTPGAYRGIGLSNATNQVAGSAELIKVNAALTIPQAPQIALGVFSVLSMATGQYFMTQINGKLEAIAGSIDRIEQFLEDSRRSELMAACQELNEQISRMDYISSEHDASNIIIQLNSIRLSVRKHIPHYQAQIGMLTGGMKDKDKAADVDKRIKSLTLCLQEYRYAVQIVAMTKLLELRIKNVMDPDQIAMYRKEIFECVDQYKTDYLNGKQSCAVYLKQSRALNKRSAVQNVATMASLAAEALIPPAAKFAGKTTLTRSVNEAFEEHRAKRKEHSAQAADALFAHIGDADELNSTVAAIDAYIETLKRPIEIVRLEDGFYTNFPDGSTAQSG